MMMLIFFFIFLFFLTGAMDATSRHIGEQLSRTHRT